MESLHVYIIGALILLGLVAMVVAVAAARFSRRLRSDVEGWASKARRGEVVPAGDQELDAILLDDADSPGSSAARLHDVIDLKVDAYMRWPELIRGSAVYIGLLGTLIGLTIAVSGIQGSDLQGAEAIQEFTKNLNSILKGFSSAFLSATSGVGIFLLLHFWIAECRQEASRNASKAVASFESAAAIARAASRREDPVLKTLETFAGSLSSAAVELQEAVSPLSAALQGLLIQQSEASARQEGYAQEAVASIRELAASAAEAVSGAFDTKAADFEEITRSIANAADRAEERLESIAGATERASDSIKGAIQQAEEGRRGLESQVVDLSSATGQIVQAVGSLNTALESTARLSDGVDDLADVVKPLTNFVRQLDAEMRESLAKSAETLGDAVAAQLREHEVLLRLHRVEMQKVIDAVDAHQVAGERLYHRADVIMSAAADGRFVLLDHERMQKTLDNVAAATSALAGELHSGVPEASFNGQPATEDQLRMLSTTVARIEASLLKQEQRRPENVLKRLVSKLRRSQ